MPAPVRAALRRHPRPTVHVGDGVLAQAVEAEGQIGRHRGHGHRGRGGVAAAVDPRRGRCFLTLERSFIPFSNHIAGAFGGGFHHAGGGRDVRAWWWWGICGVTAALLGAQHVAGATANGQPMAGSKPQSFVANCPKHCMFRCVIALHH